MRISSSLINRFATQDLMKHQLNIADLQAKISSGKRINKPSDDPVGAARSINLKDGLEQVEQYRRNINIAEARLLNEESHIAGSENVLLRVRELALIANNAATSVSDYPGMKTELQQLRAELLAHANARDNDGNYVFAGSKTTTRPVNPAKTSVYEGDDHPRLIQIQQHRTLTTSDTAKEVFMQIPQSKVTHMLRADAANTGNAIADLSNIDPSNSHTQDSYSIEFTTSGNYNVRNNTTGESVVSNAVLDSSNIIEFASLRVELKGDTSAGDVFTLTPTQRQDIFSTIDNFIALMAKSPANQTERTLQTQNISNVLMNIDTAFEHITAKRAEIGSRLASLDTISQEHAATEYQLSSALSKTEDLNITEAISSLQHRATALEALQKTITRTQGLSLFNI